ncbi:MAG: hypothetical protein NWP69_00730, partial [Congregibacter sp.]|nr:hypothetical protein [Congregibacter sp.]
MLTTLPQSSRIWRHGLLLTCLASSSTVVKGDDALLAPMASRNLSPLYANLGIPVMDSAVPLPR